MMGMPRFSRTRRIRASSRSSACFSYPPYCCVALMAATLALGLCAVAPNVTQAGEPPGPQDDARVRGGRTVEKSPPAEQSPYVKITTELGVLVLYVAPQAGRALDQQSPYSLWWRDDTTEQIYLYGRRVFDRSGLVRALISLEAEFGPDPLELAQAIGAVSFGDSQPEFAGDDAQHEFAGDDPLWLPATRENIFAVMDLPFPDGEDAEPVEPPARLLPCVPCAATLPDGKPFGRNPRNASDDDPVAIELIAVPLPNLSLDDIIELVILEACGCGGDGSSCTSDRDCNDGNPCTDDKCVSERCSNPFNNNPCDDDGNPCTIDSCVNGSCAYNPINCDDGNPCTIDSCVNGSCAHTPINCDDGNPCTNDSCVNGSCAYNPINCDDGNPCTIDSCVNGSCAHTPINCDDGNPCTNDSCVNGSCVYNPIDCDDNNLCSTELGCDPALGCLRDWIDCDDGNTCTKDTCLDGVCIHTAEHCDDSNECTTDFCLPCVGCIHDHCCDDGDPSTYDSCNQSAPDPCSECTNAPRYPPPTAEESCIAAFGCRFSLTNPFGTLLPVNDDDDNGNGTPDYLEPGPVVGENDLVQVAVTFEDCMNTMCTGESAKFFWQAGSAENPSPFRFYKNFDKTGPVSPSPKDWESGFPPAMLYVEGVSPAFDAWVPSRLGVFCSDDTSKEQCISHSYGTKTVKLSSVQWQQRATSWNNFDGCTATAGNLPMERCPNNGGLRIFPGKQSPNDASSDLRRQVDLVATVEPPLPRVPVYFRVYDVDDPFNQLHGPNGGLNTIQNVDVVDPNDGSAGPTGGDNRGTAGVTVGNYTELTNQYGQARLNMWVSMQPGDNFRVVATLRQDALSQSTQADADALSVTKKWHRNGNFSGWHKGAYWSQMLTVWRKLHVETDSMVRPTFAQNTIDVQWNQPRFPNGVLLLDISDQNDNDDFQNGFIRIMANGFPDIVALIITYENPFFAVDDVIHTNITVAQWGARPTSGQGIISDDDLANESRFTAGIVGSDIGVGNPPDGFLPLPDTSGLISHYQPAYILPVVENQYDSEGAYPFYKNMKPEKKTNWDPGRLVLRGLPISTSNYWTVYTFSAFQGLATHDADTEPFSTKGVNTHPDGSTDPPLLWSDSYTGMVAIFAEVLRDAYLEIQKERTVAHEIAHTLGVPHLGDPDVPGSGGLMDERDQGPAFLAESLNTLREYVEP